MNNRFGLKDLILFVLVILLLVSLWVSLWREDHRFKKTLAQGERLTGLERQQGRLQSSIDEANFKEANERAARLESRLREIESRLASGAVVAGPASGSNVAASGSDATGRDTTWARPGTPIVWQPERVLDSDPRKDPEFQPGGTVTEAINAQPSTVVPLVYKDVYGAYVFERICEYLAEYDPKTLEIRGVLADAWQYSSDGTWLRVHISERARFSDGMPVTADDVIWTFNWMRNPLIQAERPRSVSDFIESIEKVSDKAIEMKFKEVLFTNLSAAMGTFPILPKHVYEHVTPTQFNEATGFVVGSGPFKFASTSLDNQWRPGQDVVLVRNEQYWGPRPAYDELRFKVINDDLARITAFNNGECDITTPTAPQYGQLIKDDNWKKSNTAHLWYNIRGGYTFIGWNCDKRGDRLSIFADKRVRRAMTMLLDRELINREMYENTGRVSTGPFNRATDQANPQIEPWPYDVDKAKALLDEAGWTLKPGQKIRTNSEGRAMEFEFTFAQGSEVTERMANYLKDQCARVGIVMSVRRLDWSVFMKEVDDRNYDAMTMGWSPSSPESDPNQVWHSRYIANQGDNFVQWRNAEADKLIEQGRQTLDAEARMQVWHKLHSIIHDEQPYTFVIERPWIRLVPNKIGNFVEYRNGFQYDELFVRGSGAPTN